MEAGGVALWRRIGRTLAGEIAAGRPEPGARLPTEAQIAARFGVNRHTVRRALEALGRDGLVRVERGRGTFVAEDVLAYTVEPRTRFSELIRRQNREPSGRVLRLVERALADTPADRQIAGALGLEAGAAVVAMERLGLADGKPFSVTLHCFPAARLPGLAAALLACPSITAALRAVGVADYLRQSTRVTARLPTAEEAALLLLPRTRPLLVCENVNVDVEARVIEFALARYPTPRVQIVFEP